LIHEKTSVWCEGYAPRRLEDTFSGSIKRLGVFEHDMISMVPWYCLIFVCSLRLAGCWPEVPKHRCELTDQVSMFQTKCFMRRPDNACESLGGYGHVHRKPASSLTIPVSESAVHGLSVGREDRNIPLSLIRLGRCTQRPDDIST
jgi:hypothetical protein